MTIQSLFSFYDGYTSSTKDNKNYSYPKFGNSMQNQVQSIDSFWKSENYLSQVRADMLKKLGNNAMQNSNYNEAINNYVAALNVKPDYADVYYNLAKAYKNSGDYDKAIETYNELLELTPNDVESITNLGECYKDTKQYNPALKCFKNALNIDPKYDLASRNLKETDNLKLAETDPDKARQLRDQYAKENIANAVNLVTEYDSLDVSSALNGLKIMFSQTNLMSGHANIAQYEDNRRRIVVTDKYIWAAPEVIAAYVTHEAIHARDRDPYTSIKEEQDAYREAVKFWMKHSNGIKDPEMDYAASLYLMSPEKLDKKVAEVYSTRDGSIPEYSPNHGQAAATGLKDLGPKSFFARIKDFWGKLFNPKAYAAPQLTFDQGLMYNYCR